MPTINERQFQEALQPKLGDDWDRALVVFRNFGERLSWDIANVLLHAADQEKVGEVLEILEEHYREHLQYQHPDIRGAISDRLLGVNKTQVMFLILCEKTLGLQPTR